jgi:hypothetical protein
MDARLNLSHPTSLILERWKMETAAVARMLAPVETGRLRSSIRVVPQGVEAIVDYAYFVETGTAKMAAQPFLRPAAGIAARRLGGKAREA